MKKALITGVLLTALCLQNVSEICAQDWAVTKIRQQQRVDLRDLGYPMVNEIPENSSAITSLLTASDGKIYGGTSGEEAYLFVFDPSINKVRHLGKILGQQGIHHSLVEGADSSIYIGTGLDPFAEIELTVRGDMDIAKSLWQDIRDHFYGYAGGHIYRYVPARSNRKVKLPQSECELEDLGIPVPNNSVYALVSSPDKSRIYGLTYPDGDFFIYDIKSKKFTDAGPVDQKIVFHGPERYWRSLPRSLVCDNEGRVFMSGTDGFIFFYSPSAGRIVRTTMEVPGDYDYIQFYTDHAVVDYFAKDSKGIIYGGSSDGYLFSIDPGTMALRNLGKVRAARRLRCLAVSSDNKIFMMAGERSASAPCQYYSYDPATGNFDNLGLLIVDRSPYYYWRGQQFDCMTSGKDGTIYLGESERRSHLFIHIPE